MIYKLEDVACNRLSIEPLTSRTWTVEIQRDVDGEVKRESVIMTRDNLLDMAYAIQANVD